MINSGFDHARRSLVLTTSGVKSGCRNFGSEVCLPVGDSFTAFLETHLTQPAKPQVASSPGLPFPARDQKVEPMSQTPGCWRPTPGLFLNLF